MIALKVRLMTHPMSTLTKLVNDVRKNTELPEYLKLSVGKKRFTKAQLADHLVKLHKTKFFNGNAIKKFKTTPTTPQERKEIAKRKKEDNKKLPPITDKEISNLPAPPKELMDKPKNKVIKTEKKDTYTEDMKPILKEQKELLKLLDDNKDKLKKIDIFKIGSRGKVKDGNFYDDNRLKVSSQILHGTPSEAKKRLDFYSKKIKKELMDKPKKKVKFNVVKNNGNPWIAHVRKYAKENNMKYNEALEFAGKTYKKK